MKILVTGSHGKIGTAVVPALRERGHEVVTYDLKNGQDIFARHLLTQMLSGCEQVIHLAGIPGPTEGTEFASFFDINCAGTFAVARTAVECGVRRFVYSGSTAFYGTEPGIPYRKPIIEGQAPITCYIKADELTCTPLHIGYDVSKIIAEQILAYYGLLKLMEVAVLRFGPVKANRGCTRAIAAEGMWRVVEHPGPFWYEVFNIVQSQFDWAVSEKAQRVLGIEL